MVKIIKEELSFEESLKKKMRTLCIEEFNQEYNLDSTLKKKIKKLKLLPKIIKFLL